MRLFIRVCIDEEFEAFDPNDKGKRPANPTENHKDKGKGQDAGPTDNLMLSEELPVRESLVLTGFETAGCISL